MKKILLSFAVLLMFIITAFSQDVTEKKLGIKELPTELLQTTGSTGRLDCSCNGNLLKDGPFETVTVSGSNINSPSPYWKVNTRTPQWTPNQGPCNKGYISMWGNKAVFESVIQSVSLPVGNYSVKVTVRAINPNPLQPVVRLKITAGSNIVVTPDAAPGWTTYTVPFNITSAASTVILQPENNSALNDGAHVSWIQVDNICIEKACKIPDEKCNPKFSAAPFTVNSQCNIVVNVNPVVTKGATHYWGLLGATSISDNTPIPLSTILSGGSFGLGITSTGVATPIGMGTGITASTSGYGYQYSGVSFGQCFKITHYVKCCNKWYSQTNTYCTKVCSEVKETGLTEVLASDIPKQLLSDKKD